ncbi:MAG: cation transporter [Alphaproteobacteria bacterium]|nr:cation transporter [Alphaproteobacteria bacterium]
MDNKTLKNKTLLVIIVTLVTMALEICFGIMSKSMALTADGFHMATHALALSITFVVCHIVAKHKDKEERLNAIGGYTSAIFLGLTALGIIYESAERFINPKSISFNEAILVTVIGLAVNVVCVLIMTDSHHHGHNHCHHHEHKENLNFKAAYLHILADALTSVMAIVALLLGKYFGLVFLDPLIGIVGGLIILKWAVGLLKTSFKILIN